MFGWQCTDIILKDKKFYEVSVSLNNDVSVRYELCETVYSKDVLESIHEGVKEVKWNKTSYMYTVQEQTELNLYYIVCNEIEDQSIFVVITSKEKLSEKDLTGYMNNIQL